MGRTTGITVSLGQAKAKPFGIVLRDAIKEEFGTNLEFARAAGKTQGRISQVINGPEFPDANTLSWVLETFVSFKLRERIREAWVRDFAAPRLDSDWLDGGDAVLSRINELAEQDPRLALRFAEQLRTRLDDPEAWQQATERVVHLRLRLASPGTAAVVISEMERQATVRDDPLDLLTSLWMRGNVLRNLENVPADTLLKTHQKAVQFADAFTPSDRSGRERWLNRKAQMDRDFALHMLSFHERKPLSEHDLQLALRAVEDSIRDGDDPAFYYMGMEVRARVELAIGWVVKAEDSIDEIRAQGLKHGTEVIEKTELTRAKILIARNEKERALERLVKISAYCLERTNLHHYRTADQLILRLVGSV
ncbi:MAG: hypothetical protein JST30_11305 [Armatimonadetes bacterium]|nr:hypothetical protein [Armatimonadota bacterium]